jgi:hypothetical protein
MSAAPTRAHLDPMDLDPMDLDPMDLDPMDRDTLRLSCAGACRFRKSGVRFAVACAKRGDPAH